MNPACMSDNSCIVQEGISKGGTGLLDMSGTSVQVALDL